MMTSTQIRQSFLDFFKSKQHTIVPSSSLMPDSPNLLFTNAGMNQFVPIFLGQTKCPYTPGRAADTQKCIRAGGKHNDLEDVGLDTYHHTFFEMLGNWSFGDYFKREAIDWAWELVVGIWKFPPSRLYATVYNPDKSQNDPSEFDQDAWNFWAERFRSVGLDPAVHIVNGSKKDNFWMMGETGPCGPCSELHVDLTPEGNTEGSLVNKGDARCIEIWNLVFIQFNANPDSTFSPLPAKHVDTGMGFERVTSIIQGTKGLTDFAHAKISNYETDIFRPLFDVLEKLSGKNYGSTLPVGQASRLSQTSETNPGAKDGDRRDACPTPEQIALDIAFRVIADHIRTLSFAIADGIQPGNNDRNYVLRRILRRAVRYGRTLGFHDPFFYKLVDVLADTMGDVFPEIRAKKKHVQEVIQREEEAFNKTLDSGIEIFNKFAELEKAMLSHVERIEPQAKVLQGLLATCSDPKKTNVRQLQALLEKAEQVRTLSRLNEFELELLWKRTKTQAESDLALASEISSFTHDFQSQPPDELIQSVRSLSDGVAKAIAGIRNQAGAFRGAAAFILYDTYGFPLDLTEVMARELGLRVDTDKFNECMGLQRERARAAQKREVISVSEINVEIPTLFVGYEKVEIDAVVLKVIDVKGKTALILDKSSCYPEMGGQVGDTGLLAVFDSVDAWRVVNTQKVGNAFVHYIQPWEFSQDRVVTMPPPNEGAKVRLVVDKLRRNAIQRHHTVTHLLHWALHEVVSKEASQKGSFVGPDKLTFDFNSAPLTPAQVADIEKLVNERILENADVSWTEVPYADVKSRKDVMQFFGDKYGDTVRVVQIGGHAAKLDGYSMELCGGTHTRATGEIGLFRIVGENAIAAGVRRIEAIAGLEAYRKATDEVALIKSLASKVNSPIHELDKRIESLLAHQKALEKEVKTATQRNASNAASELLGSAQTVNGIPLITHNLGDADGDFLQTIADSLKGRFKGVVVLGGGSKNSVALVATVSPDFTAKIQAGRIIQQIAPIVGGKGGGKPDNARGGGKDATMLDEALARVKSLIS